MTQAPVLTRPDGILGKYSIKKYDHEEGALAPPPCPGLAAMLHDVTAALRTGTPLHQLTPLVTEGRLHWTSLD